MSEVGQDVIAAVAPPAATLAPAVERIIESDLSRQSAVTRGTKARDPVTGQFLAHVPTPESIRQIQQGAMLGLPRRQIAALVGIDEDTLKKHYDEHMVPAEARANLRVAAELFKAATSGTDTAAMIYWTKARMGWRDRDADVAANGTVLNIQINLGG